MASVEQIIATMNDTMDSEVDLFNYKLEAILKIVNKLVAARAIELYSDPLKFDFAVQKILKDSGYYDLVDDFINLSYDKSYNEIIALFESGGLAATYTTADIASIKALKQMDLDFFRDIGAKVASSLKQDLYKYSLSNMDRVTMLSNMSQSLENTDLVKYSSTYVDTAISNFNQSVIDMKSTGVTGEVYIYRGVRDSKTRDFCRCLIGQKKYYDAKAAGRIKSDKRRQYNCRHMMVPISKSYAEDSGYSSGSFSC